MNGFARHCVTLCMGEIQYHFVSGFGQVDLHVHGLWRRVHPLLFLFMKAFSHCLDGFGPFFPELDRGVKEIKSAHFPLSKTAAQSCNSVLINRKAISCVSSANHREL